MQKDDLIRLRHMLDAAKEAPFTAGKSRESLSSDRMLVLSLIKDIEIIGEAANNVTKATRAAHAKIPWHDIIGMRHHLIHAYFDIDLDILWDSIYKDLPALVVELEKILPNQEKPQT